MIKHIVPLALSALVLAGALAAPSRAQEHVGCFVGRDATGGTAMLQLSAEKYGDFFEVYGVVRSAAIGQMQLKADGWSGAGRMFYRHEYEGGAMYIQISDYTGSSLVLSVEGYGNFPFQRTRC